MAEETKPAPKPKAAKAPKAPAKAHAGERIAKVLSRVGVASRREAERMIQLGEVAVNGKVITSPALNVTAKDLITINGEPIAEAEPARLWLYYKPEGLVTSNSDEKGRDTVFDNLPPDMPRVMSVGRLDLNSEGLLLLTNDGALKRKLELPSTGWLRKYRVRVNGNPTDPDLEPLRRGITVDGEKFQAMSVVLDRIQGANAWLTVGIREGKNREIRRAMSAISLTVNRLIRISYGPFRLNDMAAGQVEEIKGKILREQLGIIPGSEDEDKPARRLTRPARPKADTDTAKPAGKPRTPVKSDAGLKDLSQAWQKATRPTSAAGKPTSAAGKPTYGAGKPTSAAGNPTYGAGKPATGKGKAAAKSTVGMTRLDSPRKAPGSNSRAKPKPGPRRGE